MYLDRQPLLAYLCPIAIMSSLMQEEASTPAPALFEQLENYAWDQDAEFQSGLNAILGSATTPEQKEELSLRARCFYFAR